MPTRGPGTVRAGAGARASAAMIGAGIQGGTDTAAVGRTDAAE